MKIIRWAVILLLGISVSEASAFSYQQSVSDTGVQAIDSLLNRAEQLTNAGRLGQAKSTIAEAKSQSVRANYEHGLASTIDLTGNVYKFEQKFDSAITLYQKGLREYPNQRITPDFYNGLGNVYQAQGKFGQAIPVYEEGLNHLNLVPESEQSEYAAGIKMNMGNSFAAMGATGKAMKNFLDAIEFADEAELPALQLLARLNLGALYDKIDEPEKSIYYYEQAIAIAVEKGFKSHLYNAYNNLGVALLKQGNFSEAEEMLHKAQAVFEEMNPNAPDVMTLHNLGWLSRKKGAYNEAITYLNQSLQHSSERKIRQGVYLNNLELGRTYAEMGNYELAIQHLKESKVIASGLNNLANESSAVLELYRVLKEAGDFKKALTYFEHHKEIADSLVAAQKEQELAVLESQAELNRQTEINQLLAEKQEQQEARIRVQTFLIIAGGVIFILVVVLLYLSKKSAGEKDELLQELNAKKEKLERLNQSKDKVFAVVSHDLRSPLTAIQGIVWLIRDEALTEEELKYLLDELDASILKNVNLIEDLLAWAKDQLSGFDLNPKPLQLKELMAEELGSQSFLAIQKNIEITNNIHNELAFADENAMRIVARNLISNAIKYTNNEGEISFSTQIENDSIILSIKDNGVGIPKAERGKIFVSNTWSNAGTKKEKGTGFGLSMTKEFVKKMNGEIWFESEENKGTTFYVKLPKADDCA